MISHGHVTRKRNANSQLSLQILEEAAAAAQQTGSATEGPGVPHTSEFDELHPGRRLSSPLPYDPSSTTPNPGTSRFSATILDVSGRVADAALQSCCVFLVPQVCAYDFIYPEHPSPSLLPLCLILLSRRVNSTFEKELVKDSEPWLQTFITDSYPQYGARVDKRWDDGYSPLDASTFELWSGCVPHPRQNWRTCGRLYRTIVCFYSRELERRGRGGVGEI